jgi:hypothetical protein
MSRRKDRGMTNTNLNGLDGETGVARGAINDSEALALNTVRARDSSDEAMGVNRGNGGEDESENGKNGEHFDDGV